jgi:hypothetical protein
MLFNSEHHIYRELARNFRLQTKNPYWGFDNIGRKQQACVGAEPTANTSP